MANVGSLNGKLQSTPLAADGVVYADASGILQTTSVGTATQVLTSNGTGVAPTFQAGGGGTSNFSLIQSQTISSGVASVVFTTGITNSFSIYKLYISGLTSSNGATGDFLTIQISTDGGSSYIATSYTSGINYSDYSSATINNISGSNSFISCYEFNSGGPLNADITFYNFNIAKPTSVTGTSSWTNALSGLITMSFFAGSNPNISAVNAIKLALQSGNNLTAGTISLYGLT